MDEVNSETQVFRHLIKYTTVYIMCKALITPSRVASQAQRAIFCVQGTTT